MGKKKIIFILNGFSIGGPQKSLLNLLKIIDKEKYDITLLLFRGGLFLTEIPDYVKVSYIKPRGLFCNFSDDSFNFLLWLPLRISIKLIGDFLIKFFNKESTIKWNLKEPFLLPNDEKFDLAIAYSEGIPIYYLVTKITSKIRIGRIPTDYKAAKLNAKFDENYFEKLDYLFVVSKENKKILSSVFPKLKERIYVFESIISLKLIHEKAALKDGFKDNFDGYRIFTMARLHPTKGIYLAIKACEILIKKGYKIRWYFMGSGDKNFFNKYIKKIGLSKYFLILDPIVNPMPYLKQADIYVQPSIYEGKSNAINEAKALYKPIVITNFPTATEHIVHKVNGLIADINPDSIAGSIELLLKNKKLKNKFITNLKRTFYGNEEKIIKQFEGLCNSSDREK